MESSSLGLFGGGLFGSRLFGGGLFGSGLFGGGLFGSELFGGGLFSDPLGISVPIFVTGTPVVAVVVFVIVLFTIAEVGCV